MDAIAQTMWKNLAGQVDGLGVLSQTDLSTLEQCRETYARNRPLSIEVKKLGGSAYELIKPDDEVLWKAYPQVAQKQPIKHIRLSLV